MKTDIAITISSLHKSFHRGSVKAIAGIDLEVASGEVFGFLGPNGAGKTTALRIMTTLLPFEEGEVNICGLDVKKQPEEVRKIIGYVSQKGGADGRATGWENLLLQGRLYGLDKKRAATQAHKLVQAFSLEECIERIVDTYSGGQRRRLDIALSMMHSPKILFLDEPTNGLDPQSRDYLWSKVLELKKEGVTIFLTSHYLDEVDALADSLAIMDHGKIVARGTPTSLKEQISGEVITIGMHKNFHDQALSLFQGTPDFLREISKEIEGLRLYVDGGAKALPHILRSLDQASIPFETLQISVPSLNDVFLKKTGRSLREESAS